MVEDRYFIAIYNGDFIVRYDREGRMHFGYIGFQNSYKKSIVNYYDVDGFNVALRVAVL